MLDTAATPVHDPTTPKPWYMSRTIIFNLLSAVVIIAGVLVDPALGFDPRLVALAGAVVTGGNMVLRVLTNTALSGTPAADELQQAKADLVLQAVAATPPPRV